MRLLPLLALALVCAACGADLDAGGPAGTGEDEERPTPSTTQSPPEEDQPPPFLLVSAAGTQAGVQGAYCVDGPSSGVCVDYAQNGPPEELSVVRPGEEVELRLEGAEVAEGSASVRRLWCEKEIASVRLAGPTTAWTIDLEPGMYELELFVATFEAGETSGDTSVSLGLLVDPGAPLEIMPRPDSIAGCTTE